MTKVLPPCDYVIQKTKRSAPQVVHGDKLKLCHSDTPASWLQSCEPDPERMDEGNMLQVPNLLENNANNPKRHRKYSKRRDRGNTSEFATDVHPLPPRGRQPPVRFNDYQM